VARALLQPRIAKEARVRVLMLIFTFALYPAFGYAQDDGVLNSAETINRGNFKLMVHPMLIFGEGNLDNTAGITLRAGYGFTNNFDIEGKVTFYDDVTFIAADAEVWLVRRPIDFSVGGGFHFARTDVTPDFKGLDVTALVSGYVARRLELYGALDTAFNWYDNSAGDFQTIHIVPGIEYAISDNLDLLVEFGIGVNDRASHYLSGGLAFYVR
jgi:hypothetical protein